MNTYHKTFFAAIALAAVCLSSCTSHKANNAASGSNDMLDSMTRPLESAKYVKIIKSSAINFELKVGGPEHPTGVKILELQGYGQDSAFAQKAADLLEKVVNSDEFRATVTGNTYTENNGLTPKDIYNRIREAHEPIPGGTDSVIDLRLRVVNLADDGRKWVRNCRPGSFSRTIGIDGGGTGVAAVCPAWLHSTAQAGKASWLAGHFIHEYMHILGFKHDTVKVTSVPYKIQFMVEKIGAEIDSENTP